MEPQNAQPIIQQKCYGIAVANVQQQNFDKPYIEWCYDQSGFYWYVLINGDIDLRDYVVKRLEEHNIKSIRTGKSYKQTSNGKQYDWFLRVYYFPNNSGINAGIPPTREQVYEVFNKYFILHKDKYSELEYRYNELELQIARSLDENTRLNNNIKKLKTDLYYKEMRLSSFINRYKMLEDDSIRNVRIQIFENHKLQNTIKAINDELSFYKNNLNQNNELNQEIDKKIQEITDWVKELNDLEKKYNELDIGSCETALGYDRPYRPHRPGSATGRGGAIIIRTRVAPKTESKEPVTHFGSIWIV